MIPLPLPVPDPVGVVKATRIFAGLVPRMPARVLTKLVALKGITVEPPLPGDPPPPIAPPVPVPVPPPIPALPPPPAGVEAFPNVVVTVKVMVTGFTPAKGFDETDPPAPDVGPVAELVTPLPPPTAEPGAVVVVVAKLGRISKLAVAVSPATVQVTVVLPDTGEEP